jgi:NAD dependent epimerase/dehydratase
MTPKNVLITGAGGFIGSHLAEACVKKGFNVKVLLHYNSRNYYGWLENSMVRKEIEVLTGDVRDYDSVNDATKNVDTIFHLAALIGIPYSYVSPQAYIRTNIDGTYNILESARHREIGNIMITSTSETYGTAQYVPIDEKHPAVGQSPYSATKISADQIATSFHRSFELPVKIVRPFNTYGPRQSARAIIPTIITKILSGSETLELGNTTPTRDLTFVADTVAGFLAIAQSKACIGEATNIGMSHEISVNDLALMISRLIGKKVLITTDANRIRPSQSEVERLFCDNSKLKKLTDWQPSYDLEKGLMVTIEWLKQNMSHYKPDQYNV